MTTAIRNGESRRPSDLKRWVLEVMDALSHDRRLLLALTRCPNVRPGLPAHLVNTAVLAIATGQRIGYERPDVVDLGMAALLHCAGEGMKSKVGWLRAVPEKGSPDQLPAPQPIHSAWRLMEQGFLSDAGLLRAVVAYETGVRHDRRPDSEIDHEVTLVPHPFARIIAVCHAYDLMMVARAPRRALRPDEALCVIRAESGRRYDPAAVRAVVATIGLYPVGTTVRLDTGELAVVVDTPQDPRKPTCPVVRLVGGTADFGKRVDLAQADPGGRQRTIANAISPAPHGINPIHYFLE
jgi:hypothetical protein